MSPLTVIIPVMNGFKFYMHTLGYLMVYFLCSYNYVVNTLILSVCVDTLRPSQQIFRHVGAFMG